MTNYAKAMGWGYISKTIHAAKLDAYISSAVSMGFSTIVLFGGVACI